MDNVVANNSKLTNFLDLHGQKFQVDLQAARLFIGTTDIGNVGENAVRRFLQANLPTRYSVGVGEVIAPTGQTPQRMEQTQQKDILIFDPYGCAIFGWDDSGINIFPIESIYGVIEVKTCINDTRGLLSAVDQVLEVKSLCQAHRKSGQISPFTCVFAFESIVSGDTIFNALKKRSPNERADFIFILNPKQNDVSVNNSFYFTHWNYYSRGSGPIEFVTADQVSQERIIDPINIDKFLTFCETDKALLWFYLFLTDTLDKMQLTRPNLWQYANSSKQRLGWRSNE